MPSVDLRALVEFLTKGLVDHADAVSVRATDRDRMALLEVRVAADEVGKVIGRRGRTIGAIRTLARAAAAKDGRRVVVEIVQ
ncbi:MAG: KH domain-containing protein [Armatimonadota bacterium]